MRNIVFALYRYDGCIDVLRPQPTCTKSYFVHSTSTVFISLAIMDIEAHSRSVQYAAQVRRRIHEEEDALQLGPRKKPCVNHHIFITRSSLVTPWQIASAASPTRLSTTDDISVEQSMRCATFGLYSRMESCTCVWLCLGLWMPAMMFIQFGWCISWFTSCTCLLDDCKCIGKIKSNMSSKPSFEPSPVLSNAL